MKIFLDGGLPEETKKIINLLGGLDGQTTNPSLIVKHPKFAECKSKEDAWNIYREIATEISPLVRNGSVSIEVYADAKTIAEEMVTKGIELNNWIPNAHVKLPITKEGLKAANILVGQNIRVNMTLCFSQSQAAAVYAATKGAPKGNVYVSPFVGRLDDIGINGMSLIENILKMYETSDHHVEVLVASLRSYDHLMKAFLLRADIATSPYKLLEEWASKNKQTPENNYVYPTNNLETIKYTELDLNNNWENFEINHELTDKGLVKFASDWNSVFKN